MTSPTVSILVKSLNEEARIGLCLEAAVREAGPIGGEVILVDSLSTDRTVEIAKGFPVAIVQFERVEDRGCAAAVQLGYQFARAPYIYVLDGDMELQPGALRAAIAILDREPDVAGAAGRLSDRQLLTFADRQRDNANKLVTKPIEVAELGGGGLYRRAAIESVGYLAHRGLAAYEEAELGARLRAAGWRLIRLPSVAVQHVGHTEDSFGMLLRQWRNGRAQAHGQVLRSAIGKAWFWQVCRKQRHVLIALGVHSLAIASVVPIAMSKGAFECMVAFLMLESVVWSLFTIVQSLRKRSVLWGLFSTVSWNFYLVASIVGFTRRVADPGELVRGRQLMSELCSLGSGDDDAALRNKRIS